MKITNNSQQPQGIHGVNGLVWVQPGQTVNAELTEAQAERASAIEGVTVEGKPVAGQPKGYVAPLELKIDDAAFKDAVKKFEDEIAARDAEITTLKDRIAGLELDLEEAKKLIPVQPGYEAKHRGGGSWSVMQGDTEVVEKLDKTAAEAFNALSDEDKAKFVEANKQKDG